DQPLRAESAEPTQSQQLLQAISAATASLTGERFFKVLAEQFARILNVRYVLFLRHLDQPVTRVRTLAFWYGDHLVEDIEYSVAGGPCEEAARGLTFYPAGVQERFPLDAALVEMGAKSYCGLPLSASSGRVLGHLAILDARLMAQ